MDDPRWEPGMPVLDRQPVAEPAGAAALAPGAAVGNARRATSGPPRSVPETAPTPLQRHYLELSAVALVAGFIAITALETGSALGAPLVKLCIVVGVPILLVTTSDATLRIWRSAWAWMPVNRGRGLFRLAWVLAGLIGLVVFAVSGVLVVTA